MYEGSPGKAACKNWQFSEEARNTLHFHMTCLKLLPKASLTTEQVQSWEALSNELCSDELKKIVAMTIGIRDATFSERVYVRAKLAIVAHMLDQGHTEIALKFLKKAVFEHNRNHRIQAMLLEKAAKLTTTTERVSIRDFTRRVLRDVAFDKTTEKTFTHLKANAMLRNLPISDMVDIYEA